MEYATRHYYMFHGIPRENIAYQLLIPCLNLRKICRNFAEELGNLREFQKTSETFQTRS